MGREIQHSPHHNFILYENSIVDILDTVLVGVRHHADRVVFLFAVEEQGL